MGDRSEPLSARETARRSDMDEKAIRDGIRNALPHDAQMVDTWLTEMITAGQLSQWPETHSRDAQAHFPELIRRLLVETPEAGQISMRTGDGVALAGDDGVAILEKQTKLLPAGRIRFELGTNRDPKSKATKDYDGRKGTASPEETFVFATPRRWQGKGQWAADRRKEGLFRDVIALDADDLEVWLQLAPCTHLWISERLGMLPRSVESLESWWTRFSTSTDPVLPIALFKAGRLAHVEALRSLLRDVPRVISVESEWTEDALGFLAASLVQDGEDSFGLSSTIVVRSSEAWERIIAIPGHGILIPLFNMPDVDAALSRGRHVIGISDSETVRRRTVDVKLPRPDRMEGSSAFRDIGVEWTRADRLSVLARRSMPALVRQISKSPRVQQPVWSQPSLADVLAALMLASRWMDQPYDLQVLSELTGVSASDMRRCITDASQGPDPVIRKVHDVYVFTSLEEAFLQLRDRVSSDLAKRWAELATGALLNPNPFDGLAVEEVLATQLERQRSTYSAVLRRGLADSLALAGSIEPGLGDTDPLSLLAERVVQDVLHRAVSNADGHTWRTVADVLPLLAEAAPDVFLSALEEDLSASEPSVGCLFQTTNGLSVISSPGQHHHLLWALEVLCWSPEYLVRAVQILAKLCRYELPKNAGNNPVTSMSSVLRGWMRNTGADTATKLRALDACRGVDSSTGWDLLRQLWPDKQVWLSPPFEPRYQLWKPNNEQTLVNEWVAFVTGLVDRATGWAEEDPNGLPWLVEALTTVGAQEADRIIDFLETKANDRMLSDDVRLNLFERIREIVAQHKHWQDSAWAMPADRCDRLSALAGLFQTVGDLRQFTYLFSWNPELSDINQMDFERYSAALDARRREAFDAVFSRPDAWEQLATIVERADASAQIGWALSTYDRSDTLDIMLEWLGSESIPLRQASTTWACRHLESQGPADLRRVLDRDDVTSESRKLFVLSVPTDGRFWDVLRGFPDDENLYWKEAHFEAVPYPDLTRAVEMLRDRGRAWSAIIVAGHGMSGRIPNDGDCLPSTSLVLSTLRAAITQDLSIGDMPQMMSYYVGTLLDYLEANDVSDADLGSLEFAYFGLLNHHREAHALNRTLTSGPALFIELVRRAFRGTNEPQRDSEGQNSSARHAWLVLHGWNGFPGRQEDGTLNESAMQTWVRDARLELSDLDRANIGDELIGQTLAHTPTDADGMWPPRAVRDLIEMAGSRSLESGIAIGCMNRRGVTVRGVYEGGGQERKLAEQYRLWSREIQVEWPRTASTLREIAKSFEWDAAREDREAQVGQDLD